MVLFIHPYQGQNFENLYKGSIQKHSLVNIGTAHILQTNSNKYSCVEKS